MTIEYLFWITAGMYWFSTLGRIFSKENFFPQLHKPATILEKLAFIVFTAGLVLYILHLNRPEDFLADGSFQKPLSWLLFTWCLNAATISMEIIYSVTNTAVFANGWTALALTLLPNSGLGARKIHQVFSNDLSWLNIHRMSFLLAYAFCALALPLAIQFLWNSFRAKIVEGEEKVVLEKKQLRLDRLQYRLILWGLPLLTLGMVVEALLLIDQKQLPSPLQIWTEQKEAFLALFTWFICGVYLHTRLFFGWRNRRCAFFYLAGLILVAAGHLSSNFLHFSVSMR